MSVSLVKSRSDFAVLHAMVAKMGPLKAREVNELTAQAIAYVWGYQDASGGRDTDESWQFGNAYGIHAARFALELSSSRRSIQDAFRNWRATGTVGR